MFDRALTLSRLIMVAAIAALATGTACAYRPTVPITSVPYTKEAKDRSGTLLLGEVQLQKGNHYAFRLTRAPEGTFSVGIFFEPKAGQPWFPDGAFPTDYEVRVTVLKDRSQLYTNKASLANWMQVPWGPNMNNRGLIHSGYAYDDMVERWTPMVSYDQGNMTVQKAYERASYLSKDYIAPWVFSKLDHDYTIELEVFSSDARAESLHASLGLMFFYTKDTP
jgi:hypothetical protein